MFFFYWSMGFLKVASWWLIDPIEKYYSNWIIPPRGKIENKCFKPPTRWMFFFKSILPKQWRGFRVKVDIKTLCWKSIVMMIFPLLQGFGISQIISIIYLVSSITPDNYTHEITRCQLVTAHLTMDWRKFNPPKVEAQGTFTTMPEASTELMPLGS